MAARKARRYQLILYERMMKRWLSATFWLGVFLAGFGTAAWFWLPSMNRDQIYLLWGVGTFSLLVTLILFFLRKSSYVELLKDRLLIATPFFRVRVPYKSIKRTYTSEMNVLFPKKKLRGQRREILAPLLNNSAIVVVLTKYPMSAGILHTFLSPFFFVDKTPHFVLLVNNWMDFSTELESLRSGSIQYQPPQQQHVIAPPRRPAPSAPAKKAKKSGLLSSLDEDDKNKR
jgi:hypothetical protein